MDQWRSRTGKINQPANSVFDMLINYHLEKPGKDVVFVPITLNYDRVHDGESFPMELLGE